MGADRAKIEEKLRQDARAKVKRTFLHTFRELIFGSYLARRGRRLRPYQAYDGHTLDWSAFDECGHLLALIEVMSFHPIESVESEIRAVLAEGKWACPKIDFDRRHEQQRGARTMRKQSADAAGARETGHWISLGGRRAGHRKRCPCRFEVSRRAIWSSRSRSIATRPD